MKVFSGAAVAGSLVVFVWGSLSSTAAAATTTSGMTHVVSSWRVPEANSFFPDIEVKVGDHIRFEWFGFHNVYHKLNDDCDFTTDSTLLGSSSPVTYTFTMEDAMTNDGMVVFACSVGQHCLDGMIFTATVEVPSPTPSPSQAPSVSEEPTASDMPSYSDMPSASDMPSYSDMPSASDAPSSSEEPSAMPSVTPAPVAPIAPVAPPSDTPAPTPPELPPAPTPAPTPPAQVPAPTRAPTPAPTPRPSRQPFTAPPFADAVTVTVRIVGVGVTLGGMTQPMTGTAITTFQDEYDKSVEAFYNGEAVARRLTASGKVANVQSSTTVTGQEVTSDGLQTTSDQDLTFQTERGSGVTGADVVQTVFDDPAAVTSFTDNLKASGGEFATLTGVTGALPPTEAPTAAPTSAASRSFIAGFSTCLVVLFHILV